MVYEEISDDDVKNELIKTWRLKIIILDNGVNKAIFYEQSLLPVIDGKYNFIYVYLEQTK